MNTKPAYIHGPIALSTVLALGLTAACTDPAPELGGASAQLGACGLGDEELAYATITAADLPGMSAVERAQIVEAVRESAHTDVTTAEQALSRVDDHEVRRAIQRDSGTNQFYVEIDYWVGDNPYGAVFYYGTSAKGAAIHDGFPEECGPLTYSYDQGDTAPACGGFITYVNTATYAALDAYLPSNVAASIVAARPFASVASVVAVNGVAETRLQQLLSASRTAGLVGPSCSGIHDQLALSVDEAAAIVALVNEASSEELHGILASFINQQVVGTIVATRPYANVAAVSATTGVGPATLRRFRNASTFAGPWEDLVAAVNDLDHPDGQTRLDLHFDWRPLLADTGHLTGMTCFGIDPALLPAGATDRPELADADEVLADVESAVILADAFGELAVDPAPGLADLAFRAAGHDFFGCYITSSPNPWVHDGITFFVDTETGAGVLHTFHYVE